MNKPYNKYLYEVMLPYGRTTNIQDRYKIPYFWKCMNFADTLQRIVLVFLLALCFKGYPQYKFEGQIAENINGKTVYLSIIEDYKETFPSLYGTDH